MWYSNLSLRHALLFLAFSVPFSLWAIERVSYGNNNVQINGPIFGYDVSDDGRIVAFVTKASNLDANDTNGKYDVYYIDTQTRVVKRVSADANGQQAFAGDSQYPNVSADGRYIVYQSSARIAATDTNLFNDIYLYDTQTGQNILVTTGLGGVASNLPSYNPHISADGRFVSFSSTANNLVDGDTNGQTDLFIYDVQATTIERIQGTVDGNQPNGSTVESFLSEDGRFVLYGSTSSNLTADDSDKIKDVFVYDRQSGINRLVSRSVSGQPLSMLSNGGAVSRDGRYATFFTDSPNVVAGENNGYSDVFLHDLVTGEIIQVSAGMNNSAANRESYGGFLSADGRYVVFNSGASNLVVGDGNNSADTFVYDRLQKTTELVSLSDGGVQGNKDSFMVPKISHNGRFILFRSFANNLVAGDTNNMDDVFMVARAGNTPPVANAGGNRQLSCTGVDTAVQLDGSASIDPDGDPLTFLWNGPFGQLWGPTVEAMLPVGSTVISLQVDDGNQGHAEDSVVIAIIDSVAPWLNPGLVPMLEASDRQGAQYTLSVDTGDNCGDVSITMAPQLTWYPLGDTSVDITATDGSGNQVVETVRVTVQDTTAPEIQAPADVVVEASAQLSQVALGQAKASDIFDVTLSNNAPANGFAVGTTSVVWTARDSNNNESSATQLVTIQDTTAPLISGLVAQITVEASGELTPVDLGTPVVDDIFPVTYSNDAPKFFPLGESIVTWLAIDANGNETRFMQTVQVQDSIAPVMSGLQAEIIVEAVAQLTPVDIGSPVVTDASPVTVSNDAPVAFPLGETLVTWLAVDAAGNQSTISQRVVVQDNTAPQFQLQLLEQDLWSPSHKMVKVAVVRNVSDNISTAPKVDIQVNVIDDRQSRRRDDERDYKREVERHGRQIQPYRIIERNGEWQIWVRADREGHGNGRRYQIVVEARDDYGNVNRQEAEVRVGHDRGHDKRDGGHENKNEQRAANKQDQHDGKREQDRKRY